MCWTVHSTPKFYVLCAILCKHTTVPMFTVQSTMWYLKISPAPCVVGRRWVEYLSLPLVLRLGLPLLPCRVLGDLHVGVGRGRRRRRRRRRGRRWHQGELDRDPVGVDGVLLVVHLFLIQFSDPETAHTICYHTLINISDIGITTELPITGIFLCHHSRMWARNCNIILPCGSCNLRFQTQ